MYVYDCHKYVYDLRNPISRPPDFLGIFSFTYYWGANKSLARSTSRCILCDGDNISFVASLVIYIYIYIYSTNIPPIMTINGIYETQNLL